MIAALLCWYDEGHAMLEACIRSLAFCDRLVAVDGSYGSLDLPACSPLRQPTTIAAAAAYHGLDLLLHIPTRPWAGDGIEKRAAMFRLAESVTGPDDWYFVIDADERAEAACDVRARLAGVTGDAVVVAHDTGDHRIHVPRFFRAIRGLTVEGRHYRYRTPDGRFLWGNTGDPGYDRRSMPHFKAAEFRVAHDRGMRTEDRLWRSERWAAMQRAGVEFR